ncbi:MAG: Fur family transcriptional regulator, ferric uptake regulator [Ilumatobacteraceae bacterium]|jgi:Fe2+ or Zn2+ uptake regulation protein
MATATELHHEIHKRLGRIDQMYTRGRRTIVGALVDAGSPITILELLDRAPNLTQSSAYRNLAMMEEAGVVRRLVHGSEHAHFELAEDLTEHHHHLICRQCGLISDITLDKRLERSLDAAFDKLATSAGFRSDHHDIDVYGTCANCEPV